MRSKKPRETKIIGDKRTQGRQGLLCPTSLLLNSNGDPSSRIRILGQAPRQSRECRPNFLKCSSSCIRIFFALRFYPCHWVYHVFGNSPPCFESFKTSKKYSIHVSLFCWVIVINSCGKVRNEFGDKCSVGDESCQGSVWRPIVSRSRDKQCNTNQPTHISRTAK